MGFFERRERKNFINCKSRIALETGPKPVIIIINGVGHHEMRANFKIECANNPEGKWNRPQDSLSEGFIDDPRIAWQLGCGACTLVDQRFINKSSGPMIDTTAVDVVVKPRESYAVRELPS